MMKHRAPKLFRDLFASYRSAEYIVYSTWLSFLLLYRGSYLGPVWPLASIGASIWVLSTLFVRLSGMEAAVFVPHLALGLLIWNIMQSALLQGSVVFTAHRGVILQAKTNLSDIAVKETIRILVIFLHQAPVVLGICIYYGYIDFAGLALAAAGVFVLFLNVLWVVLLLGFVGVRFRDFREFVRSIMRIIFLATPIIWMPSEEMARSKLMTPFLTLNPFYHFMEIVRAPILGNATPAISLYVVAGFTVGGYALVSIVYGKLQKNVALEV